MKKTPEDNRICDPVCRLAGLRRGAGLAGLILALVLLSSCGSKAEDDRPAILAAQEEYGTIAPEEVTPGEPGGPGDPAGGAEGEVPEPGAVADAGETGAGTEADPGVTGAGTEAGGGAEQAVAAASDNGRRVVYLILPSDEGFSATEQKIITEKLKARGYGVAVRIYNDRIDQQTTAFADALHSRPAAIICDNTYGDDTRASVQAARDAGVPTFLMDQGLDLSGVAQGQLVVDRCGRAEDLVQWFAGQSEDPINYVILGGCEEDSRSLDMIDLVERALNRYVQVTKLAEDCQPAYDEEDAKERIRGLLDANPEANTLICYNTDQTEAGLAVLGERGSRETVRVLCISGDRDSIVTLVETGAVEAAIVEPPETLADMVSDDVFRYFRTGSPEWSERRYILADILTKDGVI